MKKSYLGFALMAVLGVLPMGAGLYSSYQSAQAPSADTVAEAMSIATPQPETEALTAPDEATASATPQTTEELIAKTIEVFSKNGDLAATVGAFNTLWAGWAAWFFRRREKVEADIKKLELESGDLYLMPFSDLMELIWRSTHSWHELRRLILRTNRQFSVYGFGHVALLPKVAGRPMQQIDRNNKAPTWLLDAFSATIPATEWLAKERSLTTLVRAWMDDRAKATNFMQDDESTLRPDFGKWFNLENWRTDGLHQTDPKAVADGLDPGEIAIMLFFKRTDGDAVFTVIGKNTDMPETLEQWEDFIIAYRAENRLTLKDEILVSVVALHLPVT